MISKDKIEKLAAYSFLNGVRLHEDSILLFKKGSLPSSFQMSILAQEEIGKSFAFNEITFQSTTSQFGVDDCTFIEALFSSHQMKQGWFSREADDYFKYHGKRFSKFINDIRLHNLDTKKQNATYVGLKKVGKKFDLNGRIIFPENFIRDPKEVGDHITRINDFIILLVEQCRRELASVDSDWLDDCLTMKLVNKLERKWPWKSRETIAKLKRIKKYPIES